MRKLMWFALPFGAGCALCQYLLPPNLRLWTAAGVLVLGLAGTLALSIATLVGRFWER